MYTPARSAAAINSSPGRPVTARPSMVNGTVSSPSAGGTELVCSVIGAATIFDVHQELVSEHGDSGRDGRRDGGTEHTDRGLLGWPVDPGADVVTNVHQQIEVLFAAPA